MWHTDVSCYDTLARSSAKTHHLGLLLLLDIAVPRWNDDGRRLLVVGFPFAGHLQRLGRFLLDRFRLIQQGELVKFLDVCMQMKKV